MRRPPRVFLDTSALKHAAERLIRARKRPVTTQWGNTRVTVDVAQFVEWYPAANVNETLRAEISRLPLIAYLAKRGRIRLCTSHDVLQEFWELPKTDDPRGRFCGAPIEHLSDLFEYPRVYAYHGLPWVKRKSLKEQQMDFLASLSHPRFEQLKVAVGASAQASNYRNQLLDAYHIQSAEAAGCDYFLAIDLKLIRHISRHRRFPPTVSVVSPTMLQDRLIRSRHLRLGDVFGLLRDRWKSRKRPSDSPLEDLVALGERLEKKGYYD